MFLRFYDLPVKPLHHDEGVNTLLLTKLVQDPHVYRYDPANYHGPTLYYLTWPFTAALGLTTAAIRSATAVAGLIVVLLMFYLRRHLGTAGSISAAVMLAVSPGAVYFSRYFIHEMLLICFTLAAVVCVTSWIDRGRTRSLLAAAALAALMFATKETWIISAVVLACAGAGAALLSELRDGRRSATLVGLRTDVMRILQRWRRAVLGHATQGRSLLLATAAIAVFVAVSMAFYTSLFTHARGAIDAITTLAIWTKTGTQAHTHAWHTYLRWLWLEESPLLLLGSAGAALALWRGDNRFAMFAALWSIGIVAAYSVIPYKTPWLTLNMLVPLAISAGYACEVAWRSRHAVHRVVPAAVGIAVIGLAVFQTVMLNFVRYDDDRYPYVYAHTSREVLDMLEQIRHLQTDNPGSAIAITSADHFPLSWYLREYRVGYYGRPLVTNDPLVIASDGQQDVLTPALGPAFERVGLYRLRPGVRLVLYARHDLRRPRGGPP